VGMRTALRGNGRSIRLLHLLKNLKHSATGKRHITDGPNYR